MMQGYVLPAQSEITVDDAGDAERDQGGREKDTSGSDGEFYDGCLTRLFMPLHPICADRINRV
jgi:hypothetical protein